MCQPQLQQSTASCWVVCSCDGQYCFHIVACSTLTASRLVLYCAALLHRTHAGYRLDAPALRVLFNRFDPSGSGSLQLTEFLALTLFMRSATATFNAFDANRAGTITLNFNQFIYSW